MTKALIIIDMQERYRKLAPDYPWKEVAANLVALIEAAREREYPIFTFEYGIGDADRTINEIKFNLKFDDPILLKYRSSVFNGSFYFRGEEGRPTSFEKQLHRKGISNLVIGGSHSLQCVLDSVEDALDRSFNVLTSREILLPWNKRAEKMYSEKDCLSFRLYPNIPQL